MVTKLYGLINRYWHVVCYLFFGGLTTLVNWIVYYGLLLLNVNAELANLLAFVAGVCFAFATERKTAFESRSKGKEVAQEAWKFLLGRLGVWGIEQILLTVGLHALHINEYIIKIPLAVISAVLNFIFGRLVVFRKGSGRARAKQKQS
ncbi:MAG: GtrA family protein [Oscillospiraceae bacterium]|nr:GtrA family protein [Oscillospiraceae bacterium]